MPGIIPAYCKNQFIGSIENRSAELNIIGKHDLITGEKQQKGKKLLHAVNICTKIAIIKMRIYFLRLSNG